MLRNRMLVLVGGCLLAASAAWPDGVAYVDCSSHPEGAPVFGKPRRTPDTVASLPCGERFTILLNGFIFSRIQTKDGTVGYVYSNLLSPDRSGGVVQQAASPSPAAARKPASASVTPVNTAVAEVQPNAPAPVQVQAKPIAQAPAEAPVAASSGSSPAPAAVQPAPVETPATPSRVAQTPAAVAPSTSVAPAAAPSSSLPPTSAPSEQPQAAPARSAAAEVAASSAGVAETSATVAQPDPAPAAQPEPASAEPVRPAVQPANATESWEKPNPGVRTLGVRNVGMPRLPLIELFGGYGYARLNNGAGYVTNSNGVLGSFGWNIKPWLQVIADSSYNRVTVSGTKNVLYGNHWGVRYFHRLRHSWGAAPFVEGLIGGSRADTTVSGAGGYSTSNIGMSYKVGGGVDIHPLRHFEIRVIDFDYYRTSFGTNLHQNNYFISTGIVMRLFGRSEE